MAVPTRRLLHFPPLSVRVRLAYGSPFRYETPVTLFGVVKTPFQHLQKNVIGKS